MGKRVKSQTNRQIQKGGDGSISVSHSLVADADNANRQAIGLMIEGRRIAQKANRDDVNTLYACLREYLELCYENDFCVTNLGAYAACGLTKDIVDAWAVGKKKRGEPEYRKFAMDIKAMCSEYRETMMVTGKVNPVIGIWWQKVYEHYTDQPQPEALVAEREEEKGADDIARRYAGMGSK